MSILLPTGLTDCLLWSDELGIGYHARHPMQYTGDYFASYQEMDNTAMGEALTRARVAMVQRHYSGELIDIGIGGGRFVKEAGCYGYDVNPSARSWLEQLNRFSDPYPGCDAITCWDSLEHIPDPEKLVTSVNNFVFVSMPIYLGQEQCLRSKHFKPGEHIWYFTRKGLVDWFSRLGFDLVEENVLESHIGRHDIVSFAFRRFACNN